MLNKIEQLGEVTSCDQIQQKLRDVIVHLNKRDELRDRDWKLLNNKIYKDSELPMGTTPVETTDNVIYSNRSITDYVQKRLDFESNHSPLSGLCDFTTLELMLNQTVPGVKTIVEPSLTVADMEEGCWYLIEYESGNTYIFRFLSNKSKGYFLVEHQITIYNSETYLIGEYYLSTGKDISCIKSIKKLA